MKKLYYTVEAKPWTKRGKESKMMIEVELREKEQRFGRTICAISPVKGEGTIWVNETTLVIR